MLQYLFRAALPCLVVRLRLLGLRLLGWRLLRLRRFGWGAFFRLGLRLRLGFYGICCLTLPPLLHFLITDCHKA